jgi:hypothetical protein
LLFKRIAGYIIVFVGSSIVRMCHVPVAPHPDITISELAEQEGVTVAYSQALPLTCVAPKIVEPRQPRGLRLADMIREVPSDCLKGRR